MVFLVILVVAWAVVVLPAMLRARSSTPLVAAERFKRRMEMIAPARAHAGRWVVVPKVHAPRSRSHKRQLVSRRRTFEALIVTAAALFLVALWRGGRWWDFQILADGVLAIYVSYLIAAKKQREEMVKKVRPLVPRPAKAASEIRFHEPVRAFGSRR